MSEKLFRVLRDKKGLMCTDDINCIYPQDILLAMKSAGYTFKLNGKTASVQQIEEFKKANLKKK